MRMRTENSGANKFEEKYDCHTLTCESTSDRKCITKQWVSCYFLTVRPQTAEDFCSV